MNQLKILFKKFREYFNILLWTLLLVKSSIVIRAIDSTAVGIDLGYFTKILFAGVTFMIFKNLTWLIMKTIWPMLATYSNNQLSKDFYQITPWERLKIYFLHYGSSVALMIVALNAFH